MKALLLFLTLSFFGFSQPEIESLLYASNGEFRIDKSFTISPAQYQIWKLAEHKIISQLSSRFSEILKKEILRNKIQDRNIVAFDCEMDVINNVRYVKNLNNNTALKSLIEQHRVQIFRDLKYYCKNAFKDSTQIQGTYYLSL